MSAKNNLLILILFFNLNIYAQIQYKDYYTPAYREVLAKSKFKEKYLQNKQLADSFEQSILIAKEGDIKYNKILEYPYALSDQPAKVDMLVNAESKYYVSRLTSMQAFDLYHHLKSQSVISNSYLFTGFKGLTLSQQIHLLRNRILLIHLSLCGVSSVNIDKQLKFEFLNIIRISKAKGALKINSDINHHYELATDMILCDESNYKYSPSSTNQVAKEFGNNCNRFFYEGSRLLDLNEKEVEIIYQEYIGRTSKIKIDELIERLSDNSQTIRLAKLYSDKLIQDSSNIEFLTKIIAILKTLTRDELIVATEYLPGIENYVFSKVHPHDLVTNLVGIFLNHKIYNNAMKIAESVNDSVLKKQLTFMIFIEKEGLEAAIETLISDYNFSKSLDSSFWLFIKNYCRKNQDQNINLAQMISRSTFNKRPHINLINFTTIENNRGKISGGTEFNDYLTQNRGRQNWNKNLASDEKKNFNTSVSKRRNDILSVINYYRRMNYTAEADYLEVQLFISSGFSGISSNVLAFCNAVFYASKSSCKRSKLQVEIDTLSYPLNKHIPYFSNQLIPVLKSTDFCYEQSYEYYLALSSAYQFIGDTSQSQAFKQKAIRYKEWEKKQELQQEKENAAVDVIGNGYGRTIYTGKRGGRYYLNSRGNKSYLGRGRR